MKIKVYEQRRKKGLTLEVLAQKSGIPVSTLQRIETNGESVKLSNLEKIAKALDLHIIDLFDSEYK